MQTPRIRQTLFLRSFFRVLFAVLAVSFLAGCQSSGNGSGSTPMPTLVPLRVSSVDLAVSPDSLAGLTCGISITLTYTATFHIAAGGPGGTIQFSYTMNNGRSQTNASVMVSSGQTIQTYTFTSSGKVGPQYAYPGIAGVLVSSPNAVQSPQIQPSGSCSPTATFQVTSVDMAVGPASIV